MHHNFSACLTDRWCWKWKSHETHINHICCPFPWGAYPASLVCLPMKSVRCLPSSALGLQVGSKNSKSRLRDQEGTPQSFVVLYCDIPLVDTI